MLVFICILLFMYSFSFHLFVPKIYFNHFSAPSVQIHPVVFALPDQNQSVQIHPVLVLRTLRSKSSSSHLNGPLPRAPSKLRRPPPLSKHHVTTAASRLTIPGVASPHFLIGMLPTYSVVAHISRTIPRAISSTDGFQRTCPRGLLPSFVSWW